jgi:hypothetical protein
MELVHGRGARQCHPLVERADAGRGGDQLDQGGLLEQVRVVVDEAGEIDPGRT